MISPLIQKVIDLFSKFPTVGPRTASRFVYYLIKMPQDKFNELINEMTNLKKMIKICAFCFNPYDLIELSENEALCPICRDKTRNRGLLCLVEKESDLISIEKTKKYKGIYFILGGAVSGLREEELEKIRVKELEERIKTPKTFGLSDADFKEIIIATNPTTEGDTTALYIERRLKSVQMPNNKEMPKITRLAKGLPTGGELEYADEETLSSAFEGRK
ncbi:MAG: recombination mediator RecR [Candidatus Pacebacteria bacterium]|nr:recombination mediator RecR [Candidatus Paceibacterota bacterium]